jgi:heterodisulfide reductase subunit C/CheY-like chemotaxis protein
VIGLNLSKRGLYTVEIPQQELALPDNTPDVVILDVDAPDGLGEQVVRAIRERPDLHKTPLLLILANAPSKARLARLQPVRWVRKPLAIDVLLNTALTTLAQQGRRPKMNASRESFADRVRAIPGGEHLYMCYSCGTCVGNCPIQSTGELTYNPRRLIQKVINGMEEQAYEDRTTWLCSECDLCYPACPQKIHISGVLKAVRDLAVGDGHTTVLETAAVNERTCVACGLCVAVCPYDAISLEERQTAGRTYTVASVEADRCMACGLCAATCRSSSIEVLDAFSNEAVIDEMWGWIQQTQPEPVKVVAVKEETISTPVTDTASRIN